MIRVDDGGTQIMDMGLQQSHEEMICYWLLKEIQDYDGAVGAWTLKELLDNKGKHFSSATIGRYLKMMDGNAFTVRESNKGRVVTERGAQWLQEVSEQLARAEMHSKVSKAIRINEYTDLLDLMVARKAIEVPAAKMAAREGTREEILELHKSTNVYYRYLSEKKDIIDPALDFHSLIAAMSHNKYIKNLYDILAFEEKQMESKIEVLATRTRGSSYVIQHDDIARAIEAHEEELAGRLMEEHFASIFHDLEEQIQQLRERKEEKDGKQED